MQSGTIFAIDILSNFSESRTGNELESVTEKKGIILSPWFSMAPGGFSLQIQPVAGIINFGFCSSKRLIFR